MQMNLVASVDKRFKGARHGSIIVPDNRKYDIIPASDHNAFSQLRDETAFVMKRPGITAVLVILMLFFRFVAVVQKATILGAKRIAQRTLTASRQSDNRI